METRLFCGDTSSLLGFGCMRFPKTPEGKIDEVKAEEMLDFAYASGVKYFDTAYPYHDGESEPFVGKVMSKYPRESFLLATKLPMWAVNSKEEAVEVFHKQLARLKTDHVDFYLFHALNGSTWREKVVGYGLIPVFEQLQKEGKIRHLGFSFHDKFDVFSEILNYRKWDFCQIQFNYWDTAEGPGERGYELAEKLNVPLVIMEPIRGGSLARFPADVEDMFRAADPSRNLANWALSWVASHPNVKTVLSGMSTLDQVKDNLSNLGSFRPLYEQDFKAVSNIVEKIRERVINPCTGCRYCVPCPFGVDIPRAFSAMNQYSMFQSDKAGYKRRFEGGEEKKGIATLCHECGACLTKCPQKINIIEDLKKAVALFED